MLASVEELMTGSESVPVEIPSEFLTSTSTTDTPREVELRPLTVRDVQLIARAAKDDEVLTSILMIQQSIVSPRLEQKEIASMSSGLVSFLVTKINELSGLLSSEAELRDLAESPIAQAFFVLAREFKWTPAQVRELTLGEILGYLEMLNKGKETS